MSEATTAQTLAASTGAAVKAAKENSRERLLTAAMETFCARDYFQVSVEDIASAAGVSRMTFYRHFSGKAALAAELFSRNAHAATPRLLAIGQLDFRNRAVVAEWITGVFEADRASRELLRVFVQANADQTDFTERGQSWIGDLIVGLGQAIPAFALDANADRRTYLEAWLLIYEMLDQGNHVARGAGVFNDPLIVEILTDRFIAFVTRYDPAT